ncbi:MAG TPA: type I methionyl aminopeptidase [Microbacteriaceae bacterium]
MKRPEYVGKSGPSKNTQGDKYSAEEITKIRKASRLAAEALEVVCDSIKPGITTDKLDQIGHEFLIKNNAYPSTLGYRGFPKSLCTSLNEVICHGIPDDTIVEEGDIVNIDITAFIDGFHGDNNKTVTVGDVDPAVKDLVIRTEEALNRGIKAALPGREVNIIGRAIETYAKRFDYGVVREFTGHGVGRAFHTGLIIPHYDSQEYKQIIEPGMVFTIEPMLTLGSALWDMWEDDWTVTTDDKSFSAQFEHTILITDSGPEILTVTE